MRGEGSLSDARHPTPRVPIQQPSNTPSEVSGRASGCAICTPMVSQQSDDVVAQRSPPRFTPGSRPHRPEIRSDGFATVLPPSVFSGGLPLFTQVVLRCCRSALQRRIRQWPVRNRSLPRHQRVRQIDASMRTLAIESLRAIIGILIAFSVSWWISGALHLRSGFGGYAGTAAIFVVTALVALTITSGLPIHDALAAQRSEIARQQGLLQAAADGHQFNSDLHTALEMAEHEPDVLQVIGRALDLVSDGPGELLLADSSQAHLHQGAASVTHGAPGCAVSTPWGCPAVRRGQILEFSDSDALATCPHLQVRREQVSALCVPVTVLGTSTGVIHLTRPADEPLDTDATRLGRRSWPYRQEHVSGFSAPW